MNAVIAECRSKLAALDALEKCEGFAELLIPHIRGLAKFHTDACRDISKTPEQRAEHIQASHEFENLLDFVKNERVKQIGKMKAEKN